MPDVEVRQAARTLRGRWEEILAQRDEIPNTSDVELRVFEPTEPTPTMLLLQSWLDDDATDDPEAIRTAEEELRMFKRNMNRPRVESGARLLYPESE